MHKVILVVNTTIEGYMAGPGGELDWMVPDPQPHFDAWVELRGATDTMLVGRKAHQGFEGHFHQQATDPAGPPDLVAFARWVRDTPKVVFSRTSPRPICRRARGWPGPTSPTRSRR